MSSGLCACGCGQTTKVARWSDARRGYVRGQHLRYVAGHAARKPADQFEVDPDTGCWVWTGGLTNGYAIGNFEMRAAGFGMAHRWYYEQAYGDCPDTLDHLCRNRACVNPEHLEPCSRGENVRRGKVASRFTWELALEARAAAARMGGSQRAKARVLGERYGVPASTMRGVLRGVRWPDEACPVEV